MLWHRAQFTREKVTPSHLYLSLQASPLALSFHTAGQYLHLRFDEQSWTGALASSPRSQRFDLVLSRGNGAQSMSEKLARHATGELEISAAQGPGYPKVSSALLIGTGTGLAPLLSYASQLNHVELKDFSLVYGARNESEICFPERLDALSVQGLRVTIALSQPGPHWKGLVGYVQSHAPPVQKWPDDILACGQPAFIEALRVTAKQSKVLKRIHLNY
jgi:NAD(P)H-flavin reductase